MKQKKEDDKQSKIKKEIPIDNIPIIPIIPIIQIIHEHRIITFD